MARKKKAKATSEGLNSKLVSVSWALFLMMIGGLWLVPTNQVPESAWLLGVGLILIGLNIARFLNKLKPSSFSIALGIVATGAGIAGLYGVIFPFFPLILILIGASIILDMFLDKK
jgi:hypothetical protein